MQARRISTIVAPREEREAIKRQREADRRQAMLSRMTPEQREQALSQEADFKQAEAAKEKAEAEAKAQRTVAIVADKATRQAFGASASRGTATLISSPRLSGSESRLSAELASLQSAIALLS